MSDSLFSLNAVELNELRQFADREIAAGHYLAGARLREVLATVSRAARTEDLEAEKKQILDEADDLCRELKITKEQVDTLDAEIVSALDSLAKVIADGNASVRKAGGRKKDETQLAAARAGLEAATAFHGALIELHNRFENIGERLEEHTDTAIHFENYKEDKNA